MAEPTTVNIGLIVPNTGDLVGTWGSAALNPDFVALDGYLGGLTTINIASAPITLTSPVGFTPTPGAGPTQAQNAILRFVGTLTSNVVVTLPVPGFYIIENLTNPTGFITQFRAIGSGEIICIDQGECQHVYNDGTNVRFVNLQAVGTYLDVAISTVPAWITNCTKPPFLDCNGSTFSAVTYPYLNQKLGGTTLPDFRGRNAFYLNEGTGRLTSAGAGIDGTTIFAAGGNNGVSLAANQIPALNGSNPIVVNDPANRTFPITPAGSAVSSNNGGPLGGSSTFFPGSTAGWTGLNQLSGTNSITVNSGGGSVPVPSTTPGIVSGLRLIRAA